MADQDCPYKEIVDIFNTICGTKYLHTSEAIRKLIKARWKEGHRVDDFRLAISNVYNKWKHDEKMVAYIRPHTVFTGKFDSYKNMVKVKPGANAIPNYSYTEEVQEFETRPVMWHEIPHEERKVLWAEYWAQEIESNPDAPEETIREKVKQLSERAYNKAYK
ncbi:MAG TPA: conserved phage C-terminal domain-containing protein [Thermodesulfobacteriota bacterium]|nr:conserved phage C-terminal domain-containing protein [Thermodesulfobacteriota bacterium]